jgi:hypothetical protein
MLILLSKFWEYGKSDSVNITPTLYTGAIFHACSGEPLSYFISTALATIVNDKGHK